MSEQRLVEFHGKTYLRVGDALTTVRLYQGFLPSLAHVADGGVWRYGQRIGDASEVLDLDEPMDVAVLDFSGILSPGWFGA